MDEEDILLPLALLNVLQSAAVSWLSSVRPDGRPHSVPVWHTVSRAGIAIGVQATSVKARNVAHNPHVVLSAHLPAAADALIVEGTAALRPELRVVASPAFKAKYDWDVHSDAEYDQLIVITPTRLLAWGSIGSGRYGTEALRQALANLPA